MNSDPLTIYAAGFFDGEGCICIDLSWTGEIRRQQHRLRATIANTDLSVLELLQERWGGAIKTTAAKERHRACFHLYLTARQAEKFLLDVLPWLRVKRVQAELALRFVDTILTKATGRSRLPEEIFNKREALRLELKGMHGGFRP